MIAFTLCMGAAVRGVRTSVGIFCIKLSLCSCISALNHSVWSQSVCLSLPQTLIPAAATNSGPAKQHPNSSAHFTQRALPWRGYCFMSARMCAFLFLQRVRRICVWVRLCCSLMPWDRKRGIELLPRLCQRVWASTPLWQQPHVSQYSLFVSSGQLC